MTKQRRKSKYPRCTQAFINAFCSEIEDGKTETEICRTNLTMPNRKTVRGWKKKNKKFRDALHEAKGHYFLTLIDELDYVSKTPAHILYPDIDIKIAMDTKRSRMDGLKTMVVKLAPLYVKELKPLKDEGKGNQLVINIQDYSTNAKKSAKIIDIKPLNRIGETNEESTDTDS